MYEVKMHSVASSTDCTQISIIVTIMRIRLSTSHKIKHTLCVPILTKGDPSCLLIIITSVSPLSLSDVLSFTRFLPRPINCSRSCSRSVAGCCCSFKNHCDTLDFQTCCWATHHLPPPITTTMILTLESFPHSDFFFLTPPPQVTAGPQRDCVLSV